MRSLIISIYAAAYLLSTAVADTGACDPDTTHSPHASASAFFHSRKIERGMVENRDPVCGWEAELEWYGIFAAFEACYDMTDINGRRGRYNELNARAGYEASPLDWLTASACFVCKHEPDAATQQIEGEVRLPFAWLTPYAAVNLDVARLAGAAYASFGITRDFAIYGDTITASPFAGFGIGNRKRNAADFDCERDAGRDIHVGVNLDWQIIDHLHLKPYVALYGQFTADGRAAFDNGFFCVAGAAVEVEF